MLFFAMLMALALTASAAGAKKSSEVSAEASRLSGMASKTGRILFYMPLVSKSMKITFMPLAEELARRGHEVVIIMPHDGKSKERLLVIKNDSPFDGVFEFFKLIVCI